MSSFKKWLLVVVVLIALVHTVFGGFADMMGGRIGFFTSEHGWNEGLIFMLLAVVIAIATT
jgi:hypothetical protein